MEESPEKIELNNNQSTRLLKLGLEPIGEKNNIGRKNKSEILLDMLELKLPVNSTLLESLPAVLKPLSNELETISGLPIGKLLQAPQTKIELLKNIKDYAKQLGANTSDDIERDVTFAIYMAAIAAALLFHNVKISQYSCQQLKQYFNKLCKKGWINIDLLSLYKKAIFWCNSNKS